MRFTCLHTHTNFCDGEGGVEDFCKTAYNKGFVSLGFSAHAPLEKRTGIKTSWNLKDELFDQYVNEVKDAAVRWKDKMPVYLGLEVDYIDGKMSALDWNIKKTNLDYLISSVHFASETRCVDAPAGEFKKLVNEDFSGDIFALIDHYWTLVEKMLVKGGFDILAHADIVKKNNKDENWFLYNDTRWTNWLPRIAAAAAESGVIAEVNTGGLNRGITKEPYPSLHLLECFKKNNVPVMINADAHKPEHLGGFYEDARRLLLEAGYNEVFFFDGRKDGKALWHKEPL